MHAADACVADATANATKRFANSQARAALRGVTLHRIEGDFGQQFIATFHALTKSFRNLDELEAWLVMVDGKHLESVA